ncbi:probable serine/threonine-protein kinase DDB_G0278509 [Nylanderia fulva]|uniref:probable serine/threonine-protein kinase DDB_G0278509 n=1 Tax=Nylanderia fulva TaxID=613905 RepID=UPI0010FB09E7|nr:probable serine/threonine-protein kinase DDB_G0278509 [Nylanderia fulva]
MYPRRFNAERHYKRFHETTQTRKCCDEIFHTKSEYYDHKENVHNERKRYGRKWKEETQSLDSSIECNTVTINESEDSALHVLSHMQKTKIQTSLPVETAKRTSKRRTNTNTTHHAQNNIENLENIERNNESNNEEKSKNNMWQFVESQKIFIYRMQLKTNTSQNSAPLRSIENFTDNSFNKPRNNALQNVVKVSSSVKKKM